MDSNQSSPAMVSDYPLSVEAEEDFEQLGGFEHCCAQADNILAEHGFQRGLFTKAERERVRKGRNPARGEIVFHFDTGKSLRANIEELLQQAQDLQVNSGGTHYVGAMLQHLVGAKLDLVLGAGRLQHHGFSVADRSTDRQGDYEIEGVAIHVTTHPSEALVRKCGANLQGGLKPLIITTGDGVVGAAFLLKNSKLHDRVDVLDVAQFLTANVYERSLFKAADCKFTLAGLLERYNTIVGSCETDPSLRIRLSG